MKWFTWVSFSSYPFFLIFFCFFFCSLSSFLLVSHSLSSPSAFIFFLILQSIFSNTYHFDAPSRFPSLFSCFSFVSLLLCSFILLFYLYSFSSLHPYLHHTYPLTLYSLFPLTLSRFFFILFFILISILFITLQMYWMVTYLTPFLAMFRI